MGRTTWVKPMTLVQKFEANEPVAATGLCFEIECESDTRGGAFGSIKGETNHPEEDGWPWKNSEYFAGLIGSSIDKKATHDGCHTASNNIFHFDGTTLTFVGDSGEIGNGMIDDIIDANNSGIKGDAGDRVYWHTTEPYVAGQTMLWNHWGYLRPISTDHPLRS